MSEWIKCSERLPDDDDEVLVCRLRNDWRGSHGEITLGCYFKDNKHGADWQALDCSQAGYFYDSAPDVTHWMPLPQPPEDV